MFDFFGKVIGYIESAFNYLVNIIESLLLAIEFLTSSGTFTTALVAFLPPIIGTSLVIFIAIFLIKFLIGR